MFPARGAYILKIIFLSKGELISYMKSKYTFKQRVTAFLDILGFSAAVKNSKEYGIDANRENNIYDMIDLLNYIQKLKRLEALEEVNHANQKFTLHYPNIQAIYDNIIISSSINDSTNALQDSIISIFRYVMDIQLWLLFEKKIALRGAINLGEVYFKSKPFIMIGKSICEVVEAEKNQKYARVTVMKPLVNHIISSNKSSYMGYLAYDADTDVYFLDVFKYAFHPGVRDLSYLDKIGDNISSNLKSYAHDINLREKWNWLATEYDVAKYFSNAATILKLNRNYRYFSEMKID